MVIPPYTEHAPGPHEFLELKGLILSPCETFPHGARKALFVGFSPPFRDLVRRNPPAGVPRS